MRPCSRKYDLSSKVRPEAHLVFGGIEVELGLALLSRRAGAICSEAARDRLLPNAALVSGERLLKLGVLLRVALVALVLQLPHHHVARVELTAQRLDLLEQLAAVEHGDRVVLDLGLDRLA